MKGKIKSFIALAVFLAMSFWLLCKYSIEGQCGLI